MSNVLQSDHWMIKDVPIFIQRWQPGTCLTKAKHDKVPVWVKIHDVPLEAWSVEGIGRIASRIGIPLDMDTYTKEMCVEGKGRCAYARVLIEISACTPWEEFIEVQTWDLTTKTGVDHSLQLEYSWVPTRCDKCKVYDHSKSTCPLSIIEKPIVTTPAENTSTPVFGTTFATDGYTVVTNRKINTGRSRGRSRATQKHTSNNTKPNQANPTQPITKEKQPHKPASKTVESTEKNEATSVNQDIHMAPEVDTRGIIVENNETHEAEVNNETSEKDMETECHNFENTMENMLPTNNRFSSLVNEDDENSQGSTATLNKFREDVRNQKQKFNHEVTMENVTKPNTVSQ